MNARELIGRASGLVVTDQQAERALRERLAARGLRDSAAYLAAVDPVELQALLELVVVPESWLFREPQAFAAATEFVLQRQRRPVRILSLPCASGEEPYSLAMALHDAGLKPTDARIDAIDLSAAAIARARAGLYTRNAFRGRALAFRERHFTPEGDGFRIAPALREQVRFRVDSLFNLDQQCQPGHYDIIFCRNLLIYFDDATTARAIATLRRALADDGMLFAGYAEVPAYCQHGFSATEHRRAFALHKLGAVATAPARRAPPSPATRKPAAVVSPAAPATVSAPAARARQSVPPAPAAVTVEQAQAMADRGELQAAALACRAILALTPELAQAHYLLGLISDSTHQGAEAERHWRRCLYLDPGHYEALCHLAQLAQRAGLGDAATLKRRAERAHLQRDQGAMS